MIERVISSPYLYPLWRIAWIERAFFHLARLFNRPQLRAFQLFNFGFDISKYQGVVNFIEMVAYGAKFLILRCAYGARTDEEFLTYIDDAVGLLPLSVYHFYDPQVSPIDQANKVIGLLAPYKSIIKRVWLDLEFWWDGPYTAPQHWRTYRNMIKAAGFKVGWYTRATWWDARVGSYAADFAQDPLWAAQYNNVLNLIPRGWSKAMLWQTGTPSIGHAAGVSSREIDHNLWNDEFSFFEEWNAESTPPPPPAGGTMWYRATGNINIRQMPVTGAPQVTSGERYVLTNDIVEVGTIQGGFGQLLRLFRNDTQMQLAPVAYCGMAYLRETTYTPPGDPPPPPPVGGPPVHIDIQLSTGSTLTVTDSDGNVLWSVTA